jgi:hypothetical protein
MPRVFIIEDNVWIFVFLFIGFLGILAKIVLDHYED